MHCNEVLQACQVHPIYWDIFIPAERVPIYGLPINLRYIHKRVPALVDRVTGELTGFHCVTLVFKSNYTWYWFSNYRATRSLRLTRTLAGSNTFNFGLKQNNILQRLLKIEQFCHLFFLEIGKARDGVSFRQLRRTCTTLWITSFQLDLCEIWQIKMKALCHSVVRTCMTLWQLVSLHPVEFVPQVFIKLN